MKLTAVAVALTTGCNLRCSYCYQRRSAAQRMPWTVLRAACDYLLAAGAAEPTLTFLGGEPLLELPLMRRAARHLARRAPPGMRPRLAVTTNGTRIDGRALRFLALSRVRTYLSLDGVEAAQQRRGEGTFAVLDALLRRMRRDYSGYFGDDVTVAVTLTAANVPHLAETVRYLLEREVSTFVVSPVVTHDPEWTDAGVAALDRQLGEAAGLCREHLQATGKLSFFNLRRTALARGRRRRDIAMCRIADGHALLVDVDGQAVACGVLAPSYSRLPTELAQRAAAAVRLGAISDPDLPRRLASCRERLSALGLFDGKERKRSRYGTCGACRCMHECQVCPLSIASQPGNEDPDAVPPLPCAFNLLVAKHRRRFQESARLKTAAAVGDPRGR